MEQVEFWIWEHAMKYGMSNVIERIHSKYGKALIPNSWITALFLQEIKSSWESSHSAITFNEVNSLRQILSSTYKHYKDCLTCHMETKNFVRIDLVLRAMFLVLRSSASDSSIVKKRAMNELFPPWNTLLWEQIKKQFYINDDRIQEEIEKCHRQLRNWLSNESSHKEIIQLFDNFIKDHFSLLITFMRSIKLSMLERMKAKNVTVPAHLKFLLDTLRQSNLKNETSILNLLDILDEKKANAIGARFLKLKRNLQQGEPTNVIESTIFTLPPDVRPNNDNSSQLYPNCFESHPSMPSCWWHEINRHAQKTIVNRVTPRDKNGVPFEPFWFSASALTDPKIEQHEALSEDEESGEIPAASDSLQESHTDPQQEEGIANNPAYNGETVKSDSNHPLDKKDSKESKVILTQPDEESPLFQTIEKAKPNDIGLRDRRRKSEPIEARELDNDAKRPLKRPRYASLGPTEGSTINRISLYSLRTGMGAKDQPLPMPLEQSHDTSDSSQTSTDPGSSGKYERIWRELIGHSRQLEKLKVDNNSSRLLIVFLSRLDERKKNLT